MAFLRGIISLLIPLAKALIPTVLSWLWVKIQGWINAWKYRHEVKEALKENQSVREQTEQAQTKEERDAAAKNLIDRF